MPNSTYGKFKLSKHQNVLLAHINGPTDVATIIGSTQDVMPAVTSMGNHWASLMDLRDWELYTDDMIPHLIRFQNWLLKNGHQVEVAIIGKSELKKSAREALLSRLDMRPEQVYVETEEQAWQWLLDHDYCTNRPENN